MCLHMPLTKIILIFFSQRYCLNICSHLLREREKAEQSRRLVITSSYELQYYSYVERSLLPEQGSLVIDERIWRTTLKAASACWLQIQQVLVLLLPKGGEVLYSIASTFISFPPPIEKSLSLPRQQRCTPTSGNCSCVAVHTWLFLTMTK